MPTIPAIVLATHNRDKAREFQEMLEGRFQVVVMNDVGFTDEIVETGETFVDNAQLKARAVYDFLRGRGRHFIVVADDSGLCVEGLDGRPGVYTARYGGEGYTHHEQRLKLLDELGNAENRKAWFECALVCLMESEDGLVSPTFVGRTYGAITTEERGEHGFAFDQVFFSDDLNKTFGEATAEEKDSVSHRGRAVAQLRQYLERNLQ